MACEVPVVASRVGGLPEVVEHGVSGYLHPQGDLEGMAQSVMALLTDPRLHRGMAESARRSARERYCESKIVPLYESFYRQVLEQPSRS
jgi:glycosyltransferase involved in cell wall biosynthesis